MVLRVRVGLGVDGVVAARIGVVNDGHRVGHQIRVLRAQPMNARITSEPSHLLAGQPLGLLSDVGKRLILAP